MLGADYSDALALAEGGALRAIEPDGGDLAQWLQSTLPGESQRELWVAVGPGTDTAAMGELLRTLRAAGLRVQGFADRAALAVAWHGLPGQQLVIQQVRQQWLVSAVFHDGGGVQLQRVVRLPGGLARLHDAWLQLAAQTLIQHTRFDPLHDQQQERALRAALPALADAALRDGQVEHHIDAGGRGLVLTLTRDQLADVAAMVLQPLSSALQQLAAGMPDAGLLVGEDLVGLPGMEVLLDAAWLPRAWILPAGDAACAASLLPAAAPTVSGAVQYLTRVTLPPDARSSRALQTVSRGDTQPAAMATHVVYRGRALSIGREGLVLGREPGGGGQLLALPGGIAGLSRRHCTLRRERGRTLIVDHSSHGSFIDGARVRGRAFLSAGSVLRLGTPGIELALVSLDTPVEH